MNYLEPEEIWDYLKIKSHEEFTDKYVLKGKFHSLVPEAIIKDYETVERLLAYSYFYYALIDEAFSKSTRIFEASVTLKLKSLGIKKDGYEPLHSQIKKLKKFSSEDLFEQWSHAKELRNIFAHREAGIAMGITLINAFKHNLNMINSLFLETETIREKEMQHFNLLKESEHLISGVFIFQYNNQRYLIGGARPYTTGILSIKGQSLWVFIPITGDKTIKTSSDIPKSFILRLENITINEFGLYGNEPGSNKSVSLTITNNPENLIKFVNHNDRIKKLEETNPSISIEYMALLNKSVLKEVANFLYDDW